MKISDVLCFVAIFALLPFEAHAKKIDLGEVGIVCQTHQAASGLADRYEMNTGTTFDSLRDAYFDTGECVTFHGSAALIARYEIVHGAHGSYQVVEVADKKGRHFWGFTTLYPQPSNAA